MITLDEAKKILSYNYKTGEFININKSSKKMYGKKSGSLNFYGYLDIGINKKLVKAHRLAWLFYYGEWPIGQIDHINGNRSDNRIKNLRNVTHQENQMNKNIHRKGKLVGSSFYKRTGKWHSCIRINKKAVHIGYFKT